MPSLDTTYERFRTVLPAVLRNTAATIKNVSGATATGLIDAAGNPIANPIQVGANGLLEFYAPSGAYTLETGGTGKQRLDSRRLSEDEVAQLQAGAASSGGTANVVAAAAAAQTLPDVNLHVLTLTAAACTLTFPAASVGKLLRVIVVQDATGGRTVTWPATVKWPGGTAPTLTAAATKRDWFMFLCTDGTNFLGATQGANY